METLWKLRCEKEKIYCNFICKDRDGLAQKEILRSDFKSAQKHFDKKFRFFKRQHRSGKNESLEKCAKNDPNEMWKILNSLSEPKSSKVIMEIIRNDESISTDIEEILARWHSDISGLFSGLREDPGLAFNDQFFLQISDLKDEFENLSKNQQENAAQFDTSAMNSQFTLGEVSDAIDRSKLGKAYLEIPNEALKNKNAKSLLHKFFNICFQNGLSPVDWDNSDIKPIPKGDKDPRDPLNNRCISIMCCIAKIYSTLLNNRLQKFLDKNSILVDEQNGFRASRSCIDHIFSLVTILRIRKSQGKSTFLGFIDFKKAFDSVDRTLLLHKLSKVGIVGNIYDAISSLYSNPRSRVVLNDVATDWFDCPIGVKQGDTISPTLFAIYINDLAEELKQSEIGIELDTGLMISCLLYADDIVLLADKEEDLQALLNIVNNWCCRWRLEVNLLKTNIMHVRKKQIMRSRFNFTFENKTVDYCNQYKYLGVTLNELLEFEKTVEILAESAGRALGGIITKMIKNKGFPLNVYKLLYETCVCSITDYGAEVFGFQQYSSLEKIHSRAIRAFLGVPKTTPIVGLRSEINWLEPQSRTQLKLIRMYHRLLTMDDSLLTKKIFLWDLRISEGSKFNTWSDEIKSVLDSNNATDLFTLNIFNAKTAINSLRESLLVQDQENLKDQCQTKSKLRTFNCISTFSVDKEYLLKPLTFVQRKFLAKLRLGVLQLRMETGRYERPRKEAADRICKQCDQNMPESEIHFLLHCPKHSLIRANFLSKLCTENFETFSDIEKIQLILNDPSIVKQTAQYIIDAFDNRVME